MNGPLYDVHGVVSMVALTRRMGMRLGPGVAALGPSFSPHFLRWFAFDSHGMALDLIAPNQGRRQYIAAVDAGM